MNPIEILERCYAKAVETAIAETSNEISNDIKSSVDIFVEKIDTDKSLIQVMEITSVGFKTGRLLILRDH